MSTYRFLECHCDPRPNLSERHIEHTLVKAIETRGGLCWKFTSPSMAGVPDRLALLPNGRHGFIEVKAPGQQPRPLQHHRLTQLAHLGHTTLVIDCTCTIKEALNALHTA